jgi:hypothetical protein
VVGAEKRLGAHENVPLKKFRAILIRLTAGSRKIQRRLVNLR